MDTNERFREELDAFAKLVTWLVNQYKDGEARQKNMYRRLLAMESRERWANWVMLSMTAVIILLAVFWVFGVESPLRNSP